MVRLRRSAYPVVEPIPRGTDQDGPVVGVPAIDDIGGGNSNEEE